MPTIPAPVRALLLEHGARVWREVGDDLPQRTEGGVAHAQVRVADEGGEVCDDFGQLERRWDACGGKGGEGGGWGSCWVLGCKLPPLATKLNQPAAAMAASTPVRRRSARAWLHGAAATQRSPAEATQLHRAPPRPPATRLVPLRRGPLPRVRLA